MRGFDFLARPRQRSCRRFARRLPAAIYRILIKPTFAAKATVNTILDMSLAGKMEDGIADLIGLRDLLAMHPGFHNESRAITMMVNGFNRLCYPGRQGNSDCSLA